MTPKIFLVLCFFAVLHCETKVVRRSLVNFALMIRAVTAENPLRLVGYGNWCGLGGSGKSVDSLDLCCEVHDMCYGNVTATCGSAMADYILSYDWKVEDNMIFCVNEKTSAHCSVMLCECDKTAVECFTRNSYDPSKKTNRLG